MLSMRTREQSIQGINTSSISLYVRPTWDKLTKTVPFMDHRVKPLNSGKTWTAASTSQLLIARGPRVKGTHLL